MPELPEVETIRRQLCKAGLEGRIIKKVQVNWPRTVEPLLPAVFKKQVTGRKIVKLSRHGKWLIFELGRNASPRRPRTAGTPVPANLLVHLRMTGGFSFSPGAHDRAVFHFTDGTRLYFRDPRKFGRFRLAVAPEGLGPDALSVTQKQFFQGLENRDKVLKALLLDQSFIAGVGNIYADEALFAARLDPRRKSGALSETERAGLWKAVRRVIRAGVRNKGTSLGGGQGNYVDLNGESGGHREKVNVYGRAGEPCEVCNRPLHSTRIAQRTTVFCPHCQH